MSEFVIRKAKQEDIESIKELWKEFVDFHKFRDPFFTRSPDGHDRFGEFVLGNIESDDWLVLVSEHAGELIGYSMAAIQKYPPVFIKSIYGFIQDIAVTGEYRKHGIGKMLFENMIEWFREKGLTRVEVQAASANEVSMAFWRKMGFQHYIERFYIDL